VCIGCVPRVNSKLHVNIITHLEDATGRPRVMGAAAAADDEPVVDFNEALRRAVELKARRLAETRAEYEAAPRFVKDTLTTDRDEKYVALRAETVDARVAFAEDVIERVNEAARGGLYDEALEGCTDALAAFCYFERPPGVESTGEVTYVDHLSQGSIEGAKMVKRIMLNASACLMNADLGKNASEIEWATTQALRADNASAVAHYRRGCARATMVDEHAMEKALDDFRRAVALDPDEKRYARALSECARRVAAAKLASRAMFGKIFSSDTGIYDDIDGPEDASMLNKRKSDADNEVARVLRDESLKSKARELGFDVDSEAFQSEFAALIRKEIDSNTRHETTSFGLKSCVEWLSRAFGFINVGSRSESSDVRSSPSRIVVYASATIFLARLTYVVYVLLTKQSPESVRVSA